MASKLNHSFVIEKCDSFVDFQLWPLLSDLNPRMWLSNFQPNEMEHATVLLHSFMFYPSHLTRQLFIAAFQNISSKIHSPGSAFPITASKWRNFCSDIIVTYVTGEDPNPTDSGYLFARMARQILGIPEHEIYHPEAALKEVILDPTKSVLFVDDFVGSGNQFIETWEREYPVAGVYTSFSEVLRKSTRKRAFYTPAVCTERGEKNIDTACGEAVILSYGNLIPENDSAVCTASNIWPSSMKISGPKFLEDVSRRTGIPDTNGGEDDWRGYHKLGLTIAFAHSTPDATLPIFYWEKNGWLPLVKRS